MNQVGIKGMEVINEKQNFNMHVCTNNAYE